MRAAQSFLIAIVAFVLGGCAGVQPASMESSKVILDGSTGMLPLANALAAAYRERSPGAAVEIGKGLGTGARLRALADDKIQIALASHGVKPEDLRKSSLRLVEVAKGAIVFAVNAGVGVERLTAGQICDIYSGKARNWQAVGGGNAPIAVLTRPPTEVDPEVIRDKVACFAKLKEVESAKVMARGGDMAKALAETPNAIGMTSMTVVEQSGGKVRALQFDGTPATAENVRSGRYVLTRDFFFVVKTAAPPGVKRFLDFVLSPEGGRVISANGAVPLR
jgi:phosphate transport system substrate-binding protein